MTNAEYKDMFNYLEERLMEHECDGTLKYTKRWLTRHKPEEKDEVLKRLEDTGGFCDCEVLMNSMYCILGI